MKAKWYNNAKTTTYLFQASSLAVQLLWGPSKVKVSQGQLFQTASWKRSSHDLTGKDDLLDNRENTIFEANT